MFTASAGYGEQLTWPPFFQHLKGRVRGYLGIWPPRVSFLCDWIVRAGRAEPRGTEGRHKSHFIWEGKRRKKKKKKKLREQREAKRRRKRQREQNEWERSMRTYWLHSIWVLGFFLSLFSLQGMWWVLSCHLLSPLLVNWGWRTEDGWKHGAGSWSYLDPSISDTPPTPTSPLKPSPPQEISQGEIAVGESYG